jgi:hypothetical protein
MAKDTPEPVAVAPAEPVAAPEAPAAPEPAFVVPEPVMTAWENEVEVFWQNITLNVSPHIETPLNNFLLSEKEALKARLKQLL